MWNIRSPPFRHSITKYRWPCSTELHKRIFLKFMTPDFKLRHFRCMGSFGSVVTGAKIRRPRSRRSELRRYLFWHLPIKQLTWRDRAAIVKYRYICLSKCIHFLWSCCYFLLTKLLQNVVIGIGNQLQLRTVVWNVLCSLVKYGWRPPISSTRLSTQVHSTSSSSSTTSFLNTFTAYHWFVPFSSANITCVENISKNTSRCNMPNNY